jgi:ATPase subunit of ABC transporter with duplicated ATPase domains
MSPVNVRFIDVSFSYDSLSENIVSALSLHIAPGWTGIVGPNGSGKTTIAKLATGMLAPDLGAVVSTRPGSSALYCEQNTSTPPRETIDFYSDESTTAGELMSLLKLGHDWPDRWGTLSHGERKRLQIAVALWLDPELLALDEPTNHLDSRARGLVLEALRTFHGTGILISHDRDLLDSLCDRTVFVSPGSIVMRPGGFTAGVGQEKLDGMTRVRECEKARDMYMKASRSLGALKHSESTRRGSLSKRGIEPGDHDAKGRIDLARLSGRDRSAGRKIAVMERRIRHLEQEARALHVRPREIEGFTYRGERHRGDRVAIIAAGRIPMGDGFLEVPDITVLPSDRIGVTGDNGTGKSTLMRHLRSLVTIPDGKVICIAQELSGSEWEDLRSSIADLTDAARGALFTVVYRLGSEPVRIIESSEPSPGEMRKLALGMGLLKAPALIMMDEPTNHIDLPSIERIEEALAEFEGALVLVSHDSRFLRNVTATQWRLSREGSISMLAIAR